MSNRMENAWLKNNLILHLNSSYGPLIANEKQKHLSLS